jgi:hypothetical protein
LGGNHLVVCLGTKTFVGLSWCKYTKATQNKTLKLKAQWSIDRSKVSRYVGKMKVSWVWNNSLWMRNASCFHSQLDGRLSALPIFFHICMYIGLYVRVELFQIGLHR